MNRRDELDEAYAALVGAYAPPSRLVELTLAQEAYFVAAAKPAGDDERTAVREAVADELLKLIRGSSSYLADKQPLKLYLAMVAKRKLLNFRRDEVRRRRREQGVMETLSASVAKSAAVGNEMLMAELDEIGFERAKAVLTERDVAFLTAVRAGSDRQTLAAILGEDGGGDPDEVIKRANDRIRVTLKRKGLL